MTRTVELAFPDEHFVASGPIVSTSDGADGRIEAVVGIRTPTADALGQLVFFFHNQQFIGWNSNEEATSILDLIPTDAGTFSVTFADQRTQDPVIGASLPPATVKYRWDGHQMTPNTRPPTGVFLDPQNVKLIV